MRARRESLPCATVLIVEDDRDPRQVPSVLLEPEGHRSMSAKSGGEAIELCKATHFDGMLIDATLGGTSGVSVAQRHASAMRPNDVYLITGHPESVFTGALREGVIDGHILKPADLHELAAVAGASVTPSLPRAVG